MEMINRVELAGIVGTIDIKQVEEKKYASLSLVTDYCYMGKDNCPVVETTWHHVNCFEGKNTCNLSDIKKGTKLHLFGRLRRIRYVNDEGQQVTDIHILANKMEIIDEDNMGWVPQNEIK